MEGTGQLFIDGYNVLHAWGWLSANSRRAELSAARDRLAEAVRVLHDVDGLGVRIVFDGRGASAEVEPGSSDAGVGMVFAPADRTADGVIEALVAAARDPRRCTVVTADNLERETVTAAGASCLSPQDLMAWCERSRSRTAQAVARRAGKQGKTWGNKLPL